MGGTCIVCGCPNYNAPRRNISYFRFPNASKFPGLRQAWLNAINKPNFKIRNTSMVCELHFTEDDFDETYKMKKLLMPNYYFRCTLKPEAVPKLHLQKDGIEEDHGKKTEILKELLGESYIKWKESNPKNLRVVKMPRRVLKENKGFNLTTDCILKKPLKPLPDALQRILPDILSVTIREGSNGTYITTKNTMNLPKQFKCDETIPSNQFYSCDHCNFSTVLQVHLLEHVRAAHRPIKNHDFFHLPMKITKLRKPQKYSCETCEFYTFSQLVFLRHRKVCHLLAQIQRKWFKCEHWVYRTQKGKKGWEIN